MKKNVFALFLSLAAFALIVGCGGGGGGSSSPTVGSLKLNIVDDNNAPVSGATIKIKPQHT